VRCAIYESATDIFLDHHRFITYNNIHLHSYNSKTFLENRLKEARLSVNFHLQWQSPYFLHFHYYVATLPHTSKRGLYPIIRLFSKLQYELRIWNSKMFSYVQFHHRHICTGWSRKTRTVFES